MATFAIYTYEFERIVRSAQNQLALKGFPSSECTDEEWAKRQETFRGFFKKNLPLNERTFEKGKSRYVYDTIFIEGNTAIMKFGRLSKKNVTDALLNDHKIEDYPWCYIVWDNRDGIQRMLIEQKPSAWKNSKKSTGTNKAAKAICAVIDDWLSKKKGMHINYGDGPVFKSDDFWEYVKRYPQGFSRVHFSFPPPNLGRLMSLADSILGIRQETGGSYEAVLKAPRGGILTLVPENLQTQSLVNLSSACGKEIKAYPRDGHTVVRISGDSLNNDVAVEIPDALIPILSSNQLFTKDDFGKFVDILNSVKNLY